MSHKHICKTTNSLYTHYFEHCKGYRIYACYLHDGNHKFVKSQIIDMMNSGRICNNMIRQIKKGFSKYVLCKACSRIISKKDTLTIGRREYYTCPHCKRISSLKDVVKIA